MASGYQKMMKKVLGIMKLYYPPPLASSRNNWAE